jgi:hypothetical protein
MTITLSKSNTKIGNIASFSVPSLSTCPGKTSWCAKKCYAKRLEYLYPNVKNSYANNLLASRLSNFARMMTLEIQKLPEKIKIFRWHVGGDWASIKYMYKAIQVMKRNPTIQFYSYTKNWRVPCWLPHLEILHKVPNMELLASVDDDTIEANEWPPEHWRLSYVGKLSVEEFNKISNRKSVVCPAQQYKNITCEQCKLCFKQIKHKKSIYFIEH